MKKILIILGENLKLDFILLIHYKINMRIKIFVLFLLMLVLINADKFKSIHFKGDFVFDIESGISILPDENKEIIAVTSLIHHYALILPFSPKWEIILDEKYALLANNESLNVSLELVKNNNESSEKFLENLMKGYVENKAKYGISKVLIIDYKNDFILLIIVDIHLLDKNIKDKEVKQIIYFSTKTYKYERFIMSLSFNQRLDQVDLNNPDILNYLTIGFNIDFEREEK